MMLTAHCSSLYLRLCICLSLSSLFEDIGTPKMSTLQSDLEQNSSIHLDPAGSSHAGSSLGDSSLASGEQLGETEQSSPTTDEESGEEEEWKGDLCHAICENKWSDAKAILHQNPEALTAVINDTGRTALHVAAMFGHVTIVEELLKLLPPQFLSTLDSEGYTAIALACWYNGSTQVGKCLVDKNEDILGIENKNKFIPVTHAFSNNYIEMGCYLYSVTPLKYLTGIHGSKFLHFCFKAQCLDNALDLLQRCQELLLPKRTCFLKRWIYNYINKASAIAINHVYVDIQQEDKAKLTQPGQGLLPRLITSTYNFIGVKKLQELKLQHAQADALLGLVCKNARKAYQKGVMYEALKLAAKEGNVEFVVQVSNVIPEIFTSRTFLSCFNEALDHRQARVFNLIHGLRFKNVVLNSMTTKSGNTMMHKAATKAPDHILNRIYSPTLRVQRELQWFKEVESLIPLKHRGFRNNNGKTAEELFKESHRELMKEGEKWIKATASSCSVVGALIVTMMFAAAFTVPGGNDQNLVLMFLAILTSQYSEEKFLKSLPRTLILGLSFLFISIVCMMIAFLSAIHLMMKHTHYSWSILPIIILASVPIFLFVLSQFPLLLHTYVSTYGSIFDRKVKSWP
ncbi:hypothetical protein K1719_046313 [Acacia pycnantha]|nr:hypothetical protein K1719_046313 [Acacia pycnantha]